MEINEQEMIWEFCCYELMENCYMRGLNPNWKACPFCGKDIEYADIYDRISFIGDNDEVY